MNGAGFNTLPSAAWWCSWYSWCCAPAARAKISTWYTIFQQELDMPHPNVVAERSSAGYLRLLLSRPDQRNALVPGMVVALTDAMQADGDAVVLLGSTDPGGFWAGADLSLRIAGPGPGRRGAGPAGAGLAVGAWILPDLVGRGAALELCMTGRWVDAAEALTLGLVHRVDDDP